jgi:hypothetical protein
MGNLSPNNSEYFHAFLACFNNRDDLVDTINNVDYILSEIRDRPIITINDLFLEKNDNLGMRCAKLLTSVKLPQDSTQDSTALSLSPK